MRILSTGVRRVAGAIGQSSVVGGSAAQALGGSAARLCVGASGLGRLRGSRREARLRGCLGLPDECPEAVERVFPIALLRAVSARIDDHLALPRQALTREALEAEAGAGRQVGKMQIEPQLNGGLDLVHVLTTGSRGVREVHLHGVIGNGYAVGELDHGGAFDATPERAHLTPARGGYNGAHDYME